jgi:flagellar hook-basal body complex protein FliE
MIESVANSLAKIGGISSETGVSPSTGPAPSSTSFADILKNSINEVSKLQQDATQAANAVATGQTENVTGVMSAVEKADLAFKTLLAIRSKLMDAYEEIKQISI